jgi:ABC-type polysaccharide/polyol phosphate transport system ATPase subunit
MAMSGRGDNAMGINALDVAAIAEAKMQQEGEIARFKGCSQLHLDDDDRVDLVGRNGASKSALLQTPRLLF